MKKSKVIDLTKDKKEKTSSVKKYIFLLVLVLIILGAGCHFYKRNVVNGGMPPINGVVTEVREEVINNPKSYIALVEAINSVDVVAKVSGSLDKVNFEEGSFVKKDDVLFVIDKDRYQANYDLAKAQLESAEANLTRTERDYERQKQLSDKNIASKATFDAAESAYLQAKASVSQAKAQLELARIDLDYTDVKAYIDGEIGKTKVTVGNFVSASALPLARVVQLNPIRVAFSITDKEYLAALEMKEQNTADFDINIELANGQVMKQKLEKVFVNNEVNMGTATVAVYADINNEKKLLKPGSYVNVSIASSKPKKGMVIPESAVVQSEGNSLVFVVNEENIAKIRPIKLGEAFDGKQVVEFGLRIGEKVLTSGLSNRMLRDGAQINVMNAQK